MNEPGENANPADFSLLWENVGGNTAVVEKLVSHITARLPEMLDQLDLLIAAGRMPEAGKIAHGIKGSVANFGAERTVSMARELEILAREGDSQRMPEAMAALRRESGIFLAFLASGKWKMEKG